MPEWVLKRQDLAHMDGTVRERNVTQGLICGIFGIFWQDPWVGHL